MAEATGKQHAMTHNDAKCSTCPKERALIRQQSTFRRDRSHGMRRHLREEEVQSLRHGRVRENGVAERRIWHPCQHRYLHHSHYFAGLRADHGEAKNAVVIRTDKKLHEAFFSPIACARSTALVVALRRAPPRLGVALRRRSVPRGRAEGP